MQECLVYHDVLMFSTQNEGKSVIVERLIKPLTTKIYKKNDS